VVVAAAMHELVIPVDRVARAAAVPVEVPARQEPQTEAAVVVVGLITKIPALAAAAWSSSVTNTNNFKT
jgi:hypothetical protein